MTTTTVSELSAQAAKARAEADRLAAQASDLDTRQQAASKVAELEAWNHEYRTRAAQLGRLRDNAQTAWQATAANPDSSMDDLFVAFAALKSASAVNYAARVAAANRLDAIDRLVSYNSIGADTTRFRPRPPRDPMADTTFAQALEEALAPRTNAGVEAEQNRAAAAVSNAISSAIDYVR